MADAADSKSADGDIVRVRLPPSALIIKTCSFVMSRSFIVNIIAKKTAKAAVFFEMLIISGEYD